jgi:ketosteroid isomerase-like protein
MSTPTYLAERLYDAFARFDGPGLLNLLSNDFVGTVSAGMPHGMGGTHHGPADMVNNVWGRVAALYDIHVEPVEYLCVGEDRIVILGRYRGTARDGRSSVDAAFAHIITARDGHISTMRQITDTRCWEIPPRDRRIQ